MRDEKEKRSKQGQTNNKAKQHSTPKAVTFPKKNEHVGVLCCFALFVCLTLLASFFLPSHLSYMYICYYNVIFCLGSGWVC